MKRKIISISGNIAGGKSEISTILSDLLYMQVYSASQAFRSKARELKMNVVEFNEYIKDKPEFDNQIEQSTKDYVKEKQNIILDARLGWYVVPNSFKVYIKSDIDVAAKRLKSFCARRGKEEQYESVQVAKQAIINREILERERYKKQYNIDLTDEANYDLIIDSSNKELFEVANEIAISYNKWINED